MGNQDIDCMGKDSAIYYGIKMSIHFEQKIKKTNKTISVQKDHQEIDSEKWKPNILPGGFAGHCVNNYEQIWKVKSNANAPVGKFFAGKDGFFKSKGSRRKDIILGAHPFYDYNF